MPSGIYIIGGPTAGGKSAFALNLAKRMDGEIINGDSMQLYSHLQILTARPTDLEGIAHHLYGVLEGDQIGSVGWWYEAACKVIEDVLARGKTPIVVGGTGLYLRALTRGLSPVPDILESIRLEARHLANTFSEDDFFALVAQEDPKILGKLHPNDTQRLTRALEVVRSTQTSLQDCQGRPQKILDLEYQYCVILPPREVLYQRINDRFVWMVENGAVSEVEDLLQRNIDSNSPILKAVGVPELANHLRGNISLDQAINLGQQATRRYAKRQTTWFTRQVPGAEVVT
ncbi:MAG: tRNA (adenosine(37)-N6)-dimethylallyltransferase MiaA [Alphaproteobacteria bacterium]|jgi:tRNA dimethylallyltransferase|nr:tRNA (adenosine(37)-N6)-dimethylallyltransferase MiaA [Alphaproteobacteria bacterium]